MLKRDALERYKVQEGCKGCACLEAVWDESVSLARELADMRTERDNLLLELDRWRWP